MNRLFQLFMMCCLSLPLFGQPVPQTELITTSSQNFPFIISFAEVMQEDTAVTNFNENNFIICENGVEQTEFFKVIPPNTDADSGSVILRPLDLIFIFDNSGSLDDEQAAIRNNFTDFIAKLKSSGQDFNLGLVRYGQSAQGGLPILEDNGNLTADADYFLNSVYSRNTTDGSFEPGYQAILQAATGFNFRPGAQRVFIIITDETPTQGTTNSQQATDLAVANGVTVFALTRSNLNTTFEQVTSETGGMIFDIFADFDFILDLVTITLNNRYQIRYRSSQPFLDGVQRMLVLKTINGGDTIDIDTAFYIPGATPTAFLTQATNSLFENGHLPGDALPIQAIVTDAVAPFVQTVNLFYRNVGDPTYNQASLTQVPNSDVWEGEIPAGFTMAPGVEFYISATDGVSNVTSPSVDAPASPYQLAILPNSPPEIIHTPVTTADVNFDLTIEAVIIDTTVSVADAMLFYRETGDLLYTNVAMIAGANDTYSATISANDLSCAGIEYYIRATDNFGISSTSGTLDNPLSVSGLSAEICGDGLDNDCDGQVDEDTPTAYYTDADGDGFGDANGQDTLLIPCDVPAGFVDNNDDCNDNEKAINPDAQEVNGDGIDNNCNGLVDECSCPATSAPVCANGINFLNACEAICAGYTSFTGGQCTGSPCDVIGDPGEICCDQTLCDDDPNPLLIASQRLPDNGVGNFEYIWIATYVEPVMGNVSNWFILPNSNVTEIDLDAIQRTAWVRRCARPVGCTNYSWETNIVKLEVNNCNGNPTGAPDCANINAVAVNDGINVTGLDLAPSSFMQVFDSNWNQVFKCFDDCGGTENIELSDGTYHLLAKYLNDQYQTLCKTEITLDVIGGGGTTGTGGGQTTPTTPCEDINILTTGNQLIIDGFDNTFIPQVQVFDHSWKKTFSCFANCGNRIELNLGAGNYHVLLKYFDSNYDTECEIFQSVFVTNNLLTNEGQFNFEAVKHNEHSELIWLHDDGENTAKYLLQKAGEDMEFKTISETTSLGGTSREIYTEYDTEPVKGNNYYRIVTVMNNGTRIYSLTERINFPEINSLVIFPNPARDFAKINLENYIGKNASISIMDFTGRYTVKNDLISISSKYHQLDLRALKEGQYVVWVQVEGYKARAVPLNIGK